MRFFLTLGDIEETAQSVDSLVSALRGEASDETQVSGTRYL